MAAAPITILENAEPSFDDRDGNRGTVLPGLRHLRSQIDDFGLLRRNGFLNLAGHVAFDGVDFARDFGLDFGRFLFTGQRITRPFYLCLALRRLSRLVDIRTDPETDFGIVTLI